MSPARLMPNIGGQRQERRKLLASMVDSVPTYGIAICGEVLEMETYRKKVAAVHRISALRVACAFCTISNDAVYGIANMMFIEVIAIERKQLYAERGANPAVAEDLRRTIKQRSMELWQQKWSASVKGRWTHRLIPKLESWINRQHGEVNIYLTQMSFNHGCFRAYLHRFKHENIPDCPAGCGTPEDAEHVFFHCARSGEAREELNVRLGGEIEPETIVRFMLEKEGNSSAVSSFAQRHHDETVRGRAEQK
uniref:Reverse transcriptase zinc-binding domain-containing protein n=1 Tax=Bracon brevicornis TaxID=1563983 RepID=A0A6V7KRR8_9HYME